MSPEELGTLVRSYVPDSFLSRALLALFEANRLSWEEAYANHERPEAQNVQPYMKRARFEGYLRDAAELEQGMEGIVIKGEGPWFHTEVRSGPVILTAASAPVPCAMVHPADFRVTLAETNQLSFFGEPAPPPEALLYAVFVHSRYQTDDPSEFRTYGYLPGSAHLAVPAPGLKHYLWYMDIFAAFPDIVRQALPRDWSEQARILYVQKSRRAVA